VIVLVSPRLGFQGGVERHVHDLAKGLRQRGHTVALAFLDRGHDAARYASAFDSCIPLQDAGSVLGQASFVYVHKVDPGRSMALVPKDVPVAFAVHDHDATCVRSHRYVPVGRKPCTRAPGVGCLTQGCVLVRARGSRAGWELRNPFRLARETRLLSRRAHLVACSAFVRTTLLQAGVAPGRVRVVHPVPPEDDASVLPAPEAHVVVFAGQVIRGKGLDLVVEALRALPDVRLLVAGDGPDRAHVQALARHASVDTHIEWLGSCPPEAMNRIYDRARVVVVPSRWPEPFGMVGVEAMRRGRPVVGAWHGGIPEWLNHGETGLGFRPGDAQDLAEALRLCLEPSTHDRLARAALHRSQHAFRFSSMLDEVEGLLKTVTIAR
jgi:glycosyltransferase involved in cell wall biosynthesis